MTETIPKLTQADIMLTLYVRYLYWCIENLGLTLFPIDRFKVNADS